jgi:hypothetical protein
MHRYEQKDKKKPYTGVRTLPRIERVLAACQLWRLNKEMQVRTTATGLRILIAQSRLSLEKRRISR